jgi:hypothetical protein
MLSKFLKAVIAIVSSAILAVILKIKAVSEFLFLDAIANWVNSEIAKKVPDMMEDLAPIIGWAVPLLVAALVVAFTYKGFEWAHGFSGKSAKHSADQEKTPDITDRQTSPDTGKHDVLLYDAIHYVATRSWDGERLDIFSSNEGFLSGITQAIEDVRQYACDGDLIIWGSTGNLGPITPIDPNYWRAYGFEYFSLLREAPEEFHTEIKVGQPRDLIYKRLKTSKSKVEELWPSGNT